MGDQPAGGQLNRGATKWAAALFVLVAVAAYGRLAVSLHRLWNDLPGGGTGGAELVVLGALVLPIVVALIGLAACRWRRSSVALAMGLTAALVIVGSGAAILIAYWANLTST